MSNPLVEIGWRINAYLDAGYDVVMPDGSVLKGDENARRRRTGEAADDGRGTAANYVLRVPRETPSLNVRKREHFHATHAWRKRWAKMLLPELIRLGGAHKLRAAGRRRVLIERAGKKPLDDDNRYGGCKELIDELVAYELLIDDSKRYADIVVVDVKLGPGELPHTVITLTDVSDAPG